LVGTFVSFLLFLPRTARLEVTELTIGPERTIRERRPEDPTCTKLAICSLEGELFFGVAPELDEVFGDLTRRVKEGVRVVVLRVRRGGHPDMVCMERFQRFMRDMQAQNVPVLLCGVRPDLASALENLRFYKWLPRDHVFLEEPTAGSSTLHAVRHAYELL